MIFLITNLGFKTLLKIFLGSIKMDRPIIMPLFKDLYLIHSVIPVSLSLKIPPGQFWSRYFETNKMVVANKVAP